MNDTPTLVRFETGWEVSGVGSDGLPLYKANILIRMDRPPYLSVQRVAEPEDFDNHPLPFQMYQKERDARTPSYAEGYPLCMWPAVNEAEFKMLTDRDITTVEQLAGLAKRGAASNMPAEIRELAQRAAKLIELQKGAGKYEELLKDRDGKIEALIEQVDEAARTIASQRTLIDTLKLRVNG